MRKQFALGMLLVLASFVSTAYAEDSAPTNAAIQAIKDAAEAVAEKGGIRFKGGWNYYNMQDFNGKIDAEGLNTINGGKNLCGEIFYTFGKENRFEFAAGYEYLDAKTDKVFTGALGAAKVDWELPVQGIYISIPIAFVPWESEKIDWKFAIRPSIGSYNLKDANLTVTDRPGKLELSGNALGAKLELESEWLLYNHLIIGFGAGYRWLKFTDVTQTSKGGFTATATGGVIETGPFSKDIDYSGFIVEGIVGIKF